MLYINFHSPKVRLKGAVRHFKYMSFDIVIRLTVYNTVYVKKNLKQKPNLQNNLFTRILNGRNKYKNSERYVNSKHIFKVTITVRQ